MAKALCMCDTRAAAPPMDPPFANAVGATRKRQPLQCPATLIVLCVVFAWNLSGASSSSLSTHFRTETPAWQTDIWISLPTIWLALLTATCSLAVGVWRLLLAGQPKPQQLNVSVPMCTHCDRRFPALRFSRFSSPLQPAVRAQFKVWIALSWMTDR